MMDAGICGATVTNGVVRFDGLGKSLGFNEEQVFS
jgi:hypothetical protein